ncbi:MAG: class IV adenylate cyclase [Planctomycetota bacterium]|jgi:predicted adenylyl cyclase CyaB
MSHIDIEIKARCPNPEGIRTILKQKNAEFKGIDRQTDTYFKVAKGRLKLREGNIENSLIFYSRPNHAGPKQSDVAIYQTNACPNLKEVLIGALGVLTKVKKQREIYFINNVKFHIDLVEKLGSFVEIEAIDSDGSIGRDKLLEQCRRYMELFGIAEGDLVNASYSDMLPAQPRT